MKLDTLMSCYVFLNGKLITAENFFLYTGNFGQPQKSPSNDPLSFSN